MPSIPASTPPPAASRRRIVAGAAAAAAAIALPGLVRPARAAGPLHPTPAQIEGPFYPTVLPADTDADLLVQGRSSYGDGEPAWFGGAVTDTLGRPLAGATVEIWQCDAHGRYHHPGDGDRADPAFQGFGRVVVGADGAYRFRTLVPVPYTGRTPHIHVKVKRGGAEVLTTQLYVEDDPGNARDRLWRRLAPADRAAVTVPFRRAGGTTTAHFPIVVGA